MHINFSAILFIILGFLFWKVFPGMIGESSAADVIKVVLRIVGILLVVIGIFDLITSLIR